MQKKLTLSLAALLAVAGLTAYGLKSEKDHLIIPDGIEKKNPTLNASLLGQRIHAPLKAAPEDGYDVPFFFQPTQTQFEECLVYDQNGDSKTWTYDSSDGGSFKYTWHSSNTGDDWCILPEVNLPAGNYKVSYSYKTGGSYDEKFRIAYGHGSDFEGYTTIATVEGKYGTLTSASEVMSITEGGKYNIGLYCYSDPDKFNLYVSKIAIEALPDNMPNQPVVELNSVGLDAELQVTFPTENSGGAAIEGDITVALKEAGDESAPALCTLVGTAGETKTAAFTVTTAGTHTFIISTSIEENGETVYGEPVTLQHTFHKIQPEILPLGYVIEPDEDEFSWCEVVNSNNDSKTWTLQSSYLPDNKVYNAAFYYYYSSSDDADDWVILPAYATEGNNALKLNFYVATKYDVEGMEVAVASTPDVEALQENIIWSDQAMKTDAKFIEKEVNFSFDGEEIYIGFHATSVRYMTAIYLQGISLNAVNPMIPCPATLSDVDFDGGNGTVTLTMPAKNLGGNDIEGTIYADVVLDEDTYYGDSSLEGTAGQEILLSFENLDLGDHTLTVFPYILDEEGVSLYGEETVLNFKVSVSSEFAYTIPMDLTFNDVTGPLMTVFDENDDNSTWSYDAYTNSMKYKYNYSNQADDWFITPAIEFTDAEKLYDLIVSAKSESATFAEEFEIFLGKEDNVESMTIQIMPVAQINKTSFDNVSSLFQVPEPGRYYLGVHAVSAPNMYYLYINNIKINESAISPEGPAAVTDLTGAGNITGALNATVSFNFPTTNIKGDALESGLELTATVSSSAQTKEVTGTPGSSATVEIECPAGNSDIEVYASSDAGQGLPSKVTVNCGLDRPKSPVITSVVTSEDNGSVTITYDAVTEGVNGGNANPDGMDYYLFEWDDEDEDWYQVDVTDQLSMVYEYSTTAAQQLIRLGLQCYNGLNSGSSIVPFSVVLGKPYELPMNETFENGQLHYSPITIGSSQDSSYAPTWSMVEPSSVVEGLESENGGYALSGHTSFNRGDSYLGIPKFSTVDAVAPGLEITTYQSPMACEITVIAITYGMEEYQTLGTIEIPEETLGWTTSTIALPDEFKGKEWVDVKLVFNFTNGSSSIALLDAYKIDGGLLVGVESVDRALRSVTGLKGGISLTGFNGEKVEVINPAGQVINAGVVASENEVIPSAEGIYLVRTANKTYKVVVR